MKSSTEDCGCHNKKEKTAENNEWSSVPKTYNKDESLKEHKKTEGNNQWTSCNK